MQSEIREKVEEILSDLIQDPKYEMPCREMLSQVRRCKFTKKELHTIHRLIRWLGKERRLH